MNKKAEKIIDQIKKGDIKMKPKAYFVIGNFLAVTGIIVFSVLGTFLANVLLHIVRTQRLLGLKLAALLANFPWEYLLLAVISLGLGLWLLKKFDISYKKSMGQLAVLMFVVVLMTAFVIDKSGLNDRFKKMKPLRGIYERRMNIKGVQNTRTPNPKGIPQNERKAPLRMY